MHLQAICRRANYRWGTHHQGMEDLVYRHHLKLDGLAILMRVSLVVVGTYANKRLTDIMKHGATVILSERSVFAYHTGCGNRD